MTMEFRDIEYFAVVAEYGHLGRAAEVLGLGQPALSMSLRRLEKSARAKLVKRTPKGVELTAVGTALLSHVRRLRLARDDLAREIADLGDGRAGHVRIGITPGLAEEIVGAAGRALLEQAPKVTLRIGLVYPGSLLQALRNGEFDLAINLIQSGAEADLAYEPLVDDEFTVYASSHHRLARRKRVALADLAGEQWVTNLDGSAYSWRALLKAFEQRGLALPRVVIESASSVARYHAVASCGLLGFQSRPMVRIAARRFQLEELRGPEMIWKRRSGVYYRRDGYLAPAARHFVVKLKTAARELAALDW